MPYKDKEIGKAHKKKYNTWYNPIYKSAHKKEAAASWATYYQKHKEKLKAIQKRKYRENPLKYLLYAAKQRAEKFGVPFDLKEGDLVMPDVCPVFGTPFKIGDRNLAPSLDRVVPVGGYSKANSAIISFRANRMKNSSSLADLKKLVAWLESKLKTS